MKKNNEDNLDNKLKRIEGIKEERLEKLNKSEI